MFSVLLKNGKKVNADEATIGPGGILITHTSSKTTGKVMETLYAPGEWATVSHEVEAKD